MKQFLLLVIMLPFFSLAQDHPGIAENKLPGTFNLYSATSGKTDLTGSASFLEEINEHYSFEQIASGHIDNLFSAAIDQNKKETGTERFLWVRLTIRSNLNNNSLWILKTDKLLSEVTIYIIHADGKTDIQKSGWSLPPAKRSVIDPDVIFNISLKEQEKITVYLHIHCNLRWSTIDNIHIELIPETHWNQSKLWDYNFLSVYAGICMLATFYWLINFMFSRRVNYLYLITATLSALLFCLDIYGITSVFWSQEPWYMLVKFGEHYLWFPLMVMSHFALSYKANSFIIYFPKKIIYCYWFFCFGTVAFLLVSPLFLQWKYAHAISLSMVLLCMALGVVIISALLLKRGFGSTGFAFLAILPIFIGIAIYIFSSLALIPDNYKILTPIGALTTVIMYFYGMVHYVRVLREKRNKEILKNDQLIRRQNIMLEKTVEERTSELQIANEELSKTLLHLNETHVQLMEAEKLKADEKINTLLKEQELRSVSNMLDVQESERRRIASDLHDRLGSMLSTVKLYFSTVEEQMDRIKEHNKDQYNKATSLLDEACDEVRKISHDLVSGELVKFGLVSALRQLAKTIEDAGQIKINVLSFGMDDRLDSSVEIALYRVIQEIMNNILKHSKATEVTIQLNKSGANLNIVVEDNGVGFDVGAAREKDGMGLMNMETRVSRLNGKIQFDSGKGKGATTIIDLPV